jgi:hypothetical protein
MIKMNNLNIPVPSVRKIFGKYNNLKLNFDFYYLIN